MHLVCPVCLARNRVPPERLGEHPKCGRCAAPLLSAHPLVLDDASFSTYTAHSGLPVLVDFWATWCAPCRTMAPVLEQAAATLQGRILVAKLDVDRAPVTANRFGIRSVPTLAVFKHGKEVQRTSGTLAFGPLMAWLKST